MTFTHHGAVSGVTNSCHQFTLADGQSVLVDCGLFQGAETSTDGAGAEHLEVNFPIDKLHALIVSHVDIDHVGRSRTCSPRGSRARSRNNLLQLHS